MHRFYVKGLAAVGSCVELGPDETRHMVRALRLGPGAEVELFDGSGRIALARLTEISGARGRPGRTASAQVISVREAEPDADVRIALATAIPKGTRMAELLRACTELGADAFFPMVAERSAVRPPPGYVSERWLRIAREAAGQSRRSCIPAIAPVCGFEDVLARRSEFDLALLADADPGARSLREVLPPPGAIRSALVLIGPEGGFTEDERASAEAGGFVRARLDGPVMRIETAAVALCAAVLFACGRGRG